MATTHTPTVPMSRFLTDSNCLLGNRRVSSQEDFSKNRSVGALTEGSETSILSKSTLKSFQIKVASSDFEKTFEEATRYVRTGAFQEKFEVQNSHFCRIPEPMSFSGSSEF